MARGGESDAAVAALFGLGCVEDVSRYGIYPAYLIAFGRCQDITQTFEFPRPHLSN